MDIVKSIKRLIIHAQAGFDFVSERLSAKGAAVVGANGAGSGAVLAIVFSLLGSTDHREDFIEEKAQYQPVSMIVGFPNKCQIDGTFHMPVAGPHGGWSIYKGSAGFYKALSDEQGEEFAEGFRGCMKLVREFEQFRPDLDIEFEHEISQPLRTEYPDGGDRYDFRRLSRDTDNVSRDLESWLKDFSGDVQQDSAVNEFADIWEGAVKAAEDGELYQPSEDENVETLHYQDGRYSLPWTIPSYVFYGFSIAGLMIGGLSGTPSSAYQARKDGRNKRLKDLDNNRSNPF